MLGILLAVIAGVGRAAEEPPSLNPFGKMPSEREDAMPGYLEMSDGSIHYGQLYMTRDKRFQVYDEKAQRQREVPLRVVKQLDCKVKKEWMEKEWKFKELAKDEKMYTGRGVSRPRVHPHAQAGKRRDDRRPAVGHRLRAAAHLQPRPHGGAQAAGRAPAVPAPQTRQGGNRHRTQFATLRQVD